MHRLLGLYRWLFARPGLSQLNTHVFKLSLRGIGVLNSEGPQVTGEAWFLCQLAASGQIKTIVDVGANTDVYGATEIPGATIYAFEPHPLTVKKLRARIARAQQKNVQVFHMALADRAGSMKLWDFADDAVKKHLQPTATLASLNKQVIEQLHGQKAKSFAVKVETLDRMATQLKLNTIDVLKVDTEGYEYAVLVGAKKLLARRKIRVIQFEFNEMNAYTRTFMKDFMELLPTHEFFRLLPNGLFPMGTYRPLTHEVFGFQNIVALPQSDPLLRRFARIE